MALNAGSIIGHYEILSPLGAGGMGEVWRARDTRLNREVAIKVLPAAFASDAERLRRFEHEAKAASALNHPHIITIHDIGQTEAVRFIVLEYVQGRTLRALIGEPHSPQTLARLGSQMAKALLDELNSLIPGFSADPGLANLYDESACLPDSAGLR